MAVNVDPGAGEGGTVEITKLVTVTGGSLTPLGGERVGEGELAPGRDEISVSGSDVVSGSGKDEISVGGNDEISVDGNDEISVGENEEMSVSGKDEVWVGGNDEISVSGKDGVWVGGNDEISVRGKDERSGVDTLSADRDTEFDNGS